jgi:hypothetical protein
MKTDAEKSLDLLMCTPVTEMTLEQLTTAQPLARAYLPPDHPFLYLVGKEISLRKFVR